MTFKIGNWESCVCVCLHERVWSLRGKITPCWEQILCWCCNYLMVGGKEERKKEKRKVSHFYTCLTAKQRLGKPGKDK